MYARLSLVIAMLMILGHDVLALVWAFLVNSVPWIARTYLARSAYCGLLCCDTIVLYFPLLLCTAGLVQGFIAFQPVSFAGLPSHVHQIHRWAYCGAMHDISLPFSQRFRPTTSESIGKVRLHKNRNIHPSHRDETRMQRGRVRKAETGEALTRSVRDVTQLRGTTFVIRTRHWLPCCEPV